MSARIFKSSNKTALYIIAIVIIVVAFFLLGGGTWTRGIMHGSRSAGMASLQWAQILISLALGFLLGFLVARKKW